MIWLRTIVVLLSTLIGTHAGADDETVADDVDTDIEILVARVLPRAKTDLRLHGGFLPFGGALMADGQIGLVSGKKPATAEDLENVTLDVALSLRLLVREKEARAICLAALVHTTPPGQTKKTDAIWLRVEHRAGLSKSVFHPYEILDSGRLQLGTPFKITESREFFDIE